jgi:IS30 family transposase
MPYTHITNDERDALQVMRSKGIKISIIAGVLGRHVSSIYREVERNSDSFNIYLAEKAHRKSIKRRALNRPKPVTGNKPLLKCVERLIRKEYSPDEIVGRLQLEGRHPTWHISHETIYKYIYEQVKVGNDLRSYLRQGHRTRRKRRLAKDRRGIIADRVFIDQRPTIVDQRTRTGDWEGDTVEGAGKKGYVATWTERRCKYLVAYTLDRKASDKLVTGAKKAFRSIPEEYRKTFTVDNGKEFSRHKELSKSLKGKVYFANPYHPWERGLNENTNGLLRQYLPKKKSFEDLTQKELAKIVSKLNNRPRKSLGYRTPREAFFNLPLALQT